MDAITAVFTTQPQLVAATIAQSHEAAVVLGGMVVRVMTRRKGDDR
jgi:hypothetical protein